jgi:helicase SWR1
VLFGFNVDTQTSFISPQRQSKDQWDNVIEAVISQREGTNKLQSGRQIASQIASKVQAYWDVREARKEKIKLQEERRLRALAKATIKMVTNEWKKAVFVRLFLLYALLKFNCRLAAHSRTRKAEARS